MAEPTALDRYQLAGLDDRERGFSRPIQIQTAGAGFQALFTYERQAIASDSQATRDEALHQLIQTLHRHGFRQLKTQMSFRGGVYLGSQELWIEYPDPQPELKPQGLIATIASWFGRLSAERERP